MTVPEVPVHTEAGARPPLLRHSRSPRYLSLMVRRGYAMIWLGVALTCILGSGYLTWRWNTRGRFLNVAGRIEREATVARGMGMPTDEAMHEQIIQIANEEDVRIEGLEVTHQIIVQPSPRTDMVPPTGIVAYSFTGTMHAEHLGIANADPLRGTIQVTYSPAPDSR